ncbi:MAG TPA: VOC family protein [Pyrinomonadaceae bacterium]|jgi:predicted 3-demethylubiquinone-9 3-methyltransferase (glyoxalase superfamily)|nr:VOC family protein [Pyrinomonadaceae bacterium]
MAVTTATSRSERTQPTPQKITTFLWFNNNAEEAINFYASVFKNSRILNTTRYGDSGAGPKGTVMTIDFELDGQQFVALNGGPNFKFTEAISLVVNCENQQEVDYFWEKLSEGGQKVECGWLKDKFGLSWQVVPKILWELFQGGDQAKTDRIMKAVMQMKKLDVEGLKKAAEGR